jgi:hypothetical protein
VISLPVEVPAVEPLSVLSRFRIEFYDCLYTRADTLFELTDATLCTDGAPGCPDRARTVPW